MTDIPNNALDALRASDQWLRTIVEKIDIDPDKTEFAVDAVSSTSRRPLARTTLTERLAANKSVLDAAENAAKRLPTLEEAAHAAAILLRCNGHDLDVWTGGIWPDDADTSLKAVIQKYREQAEIEGK
ncbi:hypothetical protein AA14337_0755 [Acetobacter malorum DSM 14337]|uniref:Phage protein n=1 Tax=Acetobacter malorum DSM 14337 TaxID=1307910 RepID=A0ABQ0PP66_9PROT|nr:hypothetical protein [Acetobacter malorum]GBQ77223.1 hypothetical protein AA14337_0755 [Acetobacter malorum DSM 14337]